MAEAGSPSLQDGISFRDQIDNFSTALLATRKDVMDTQSSLRRLEQQIGMSKVSRQGDQSPVSADAITELVKQQIRQAMSASEPNQDVQSFFAQQVGAQLQDHAERNVPVEKVGAISLRVGALESAVTELTSRCISEAELAKQRSNAMDERMSESETQLLQIVKHTEKANMLRDCLFPQFGEMTRRLVHMESTMQEQTNALNACITDNENKLTKALEHEAQARTDALDGLENQCNTLRAALNKILATCDDELTSLPKFGEVTRRLSHMELVVTQQTEALNKSIGENEGKLQVALARETRERSLMVKGIEDQFNVLRLALNDTKGSQMASPTKAAGSMHDQFASSLKVDEMARRLAHMEGTLTEQTNALNRCIGENEAKLSQALASEADERALAIRNLEDICCGMQSIIETRPGKISDGESLELWEKQAVVSSKFGSLSQRLFQIEEKLAEQTDSFSRFSDNELKLSQLLEVESKERASAVLMLEDRCDDVQKALVHLESQRSIKSAKGNGQSSESPFGLEEVHGGMEDLRAAIGDVRKELKELHSSTDSIKERFDVFQQSDEEVRALKRNWASAQTALTQDMCQLMGRMKADQPDGQAPVSNLQRERQELQKAVASELRNLSPAPALMPTSIESWRSPLLGTTISASQQLSHQPSSQQLSHQQSPALEGLSTGPKSPATSYRRVRSPGDSMNNAVTPQVAATSKSGASTDRHRSPSIHSARSSMQTARTRGAASIPAPGTYRHVSSSSVNVAPASSRQNDQHSMTAAPHGGRPGHGSVNIPAARVKPTPAMALGSRNLSANKLPPQAYQRFA